MRGMTVLGNNMSYFTGHAALNRRPTLPRHGREDELLRAGYIITIPDYAYLRRSVDATRRGELSDEIPMWLSFPSVSDRTLVPPGSDGDCLYIMVPAAPYELSGGADWGSEKEKFLERCLDIVDGYSPGIKDSVIGTYAKSPKDMSPWIHKGNSAHVDMSLSQLGPWRPTPSLAGFKTPIDRLWHAGAGAHPIPAVNGWSGRTAARTVLQAMRTSNEGRRSSGSR
jgi:beta-carotene ketolase (CrtO type)